MADRYFVGIRSACWTALQAVLFFYPTGGNYPEK